MEDHIINSYRALKINQTDNVATALTELPEGAEVDIVIEDGGSEQVVAIDHIPMAHKIALSEIAIGERIVKYGEPIGEATRHIRQGEHVHIVNVKSLRAGG
jgi:altronate dehydratase small subunit